MYIGSRIFLFVLGTIQAFAVGPRLVPYMDLRSAGLVAAGVIGVVASLVLAAQAQGRDRLKPQTHRPRERGDHSPQGNTRARHLTSCSRAVSYRKETKMRIGLIAPPWIPVPPPAYGGTEAVVDTLARSLAAAGHDVLLAASADSTCPVEKVAGPPVGNRAAIGSRADELRHTVLAYRALAAVDLIHDHTLAGPLHRPRTGQTPVVTTAHGLFLPGLRELYRKMALDTAIIAISHHQAGTAPASTVKRVIHHGIDTDSVPQGNGEGGYAAFLGRMHPAKGLVQAIEAARLARMPLRIAAKMYTRDEFEYFSTVIKPLLGHGAEYLGELNTTDKYALLGGAAALLNPIQWSEPFGMVMIEALASGTPVVATSCGSAPEIIQEGTTGYLRSGPSGLAEALLSAATLDRRSCRHAAETRFSAHRMAAEHLQFYQELLRGDAKPQPTITSGTGPASTTDNDDLAHARDPE
ncbi:glycosyltransferase [Arthrobacter bambusae]